MSAIPNLEALARREAGGPIEHIGHVTDILVDGTRYSATAVQHLVRCITVLEADIERLNARIAELERERNAPLLQMDFAAQRHLEKRGIYDYHSHQ